MTLKVVTLTSRFVGNTTVNTANGSTMERPLHLNTSIDGKSFWSNEPLRGGTAVLLEERKAGTKYTRTDGTEGVIAKDGFNLVGVIGNAASVAEIAATKAALAGLDI